MTQAWSGKVANQKNRNLGVHVFGRKQHLILLLFWEMFEKIKQNIFFYCCFLWINFFRTVIYNIKVSTQEATCSLKDSIMELACAVWIYYGGQKRTVSLTRLALTEVSPPHPGPITTFCSHVFYFDGGKNQRFVWMAKYDMNIMASINWQILFHFYIPGGGVTNVSWHTGYHVFYLPLWTLVIW